MFLDAHGRPSSAVPVWALVSSFIVRRKTPVLRFGCIAVVRQCLMILGADSRVRRLSRWRLLVLVSMLLSAIGCDRNAASGGRGAKKPHGPTAEQTADAGTSAGNSLYGSTNYELLAVLVNKRNAATALPTLRVHGSPKSAVKKLFSPVIAQYEEELTDARRRASDTIAEIQDASAELDTAEKKLTDEYATMRPQVADGPEATSRNPLRELSKVRAAKTKADTWFKDSYAERIDPLKAILKGLYQRKIADQLAIEFLQAGFKDRLFAALDSIPTADRRQWTTDTQGKSKIAVPNDEPWAIWAETSHSETVAWVTKRNIDAKHRLVEDWGTNKYEIQTEITVDETTYPQLKTSKVRWLLHVPDDLDSNKKIVIDQESAFDLQDVTVESGGSDGQYLRKGGKS